MEIPDRAGVMILGGSNLFPQALLPLFIFEPRYRTLLSEALEGQRMFCIAMQKPGAKRESPCPIAGLGLIRASVLNDNGTSNLVLLGITRVRLGRLVQTRPYRQHLIETVSAPETESLAADALAERALDLVERRLQMATHLPAALLHPLVPKAAAEGAVRVEDCMNALREIECRGALADLIASLLLSDGGARQTILQSLDIEERLRHLNRFLTAEIVRAQKDPIE